MAGTIYGLIRELSQEATGTDYIMTPNFDILYENGLDEHGTPQGHYILPIIKCFDKDWEEISLDRSRVWIGQTDGQWSIHCNANNVQGVLKFVQVK